MELRFSHADMGRTRLAAQANVATEVESSLRLLRGRPHPCFATWRRDLPVWIGQPKSMAAYEKVAVEPFWERIELLIAADRVRRSKALLDGGLDALLSQLHPAVRWHVPHLSIHNGQTAAAALDGDGVILQPSVFFFRPPEIRRNGDGQVVLTYPVSCELDEAVHVNVSPLIGRTRATLLELLDEKACTTTDLATGTGLTLAAISQHIGVLRDSGMVVTQAFGRSRWHSLTPGGARLLGKQTMSACRGQQSA